MSPVDFICAVIVFVGGWFLGAAEWHLKRPAKLESKPAPKKAKGTHSLEGRQVNRDFDVRRSSISRIARGLRYPHIQFWGASQT